MVLAVATVTTYISYFNPSSGDLTGYAGWWRRPAPLTAVAQSSGTGFDDTVAVLKAVWDGPTS